MSYLYEYPAKYQEIHAESMAYLQQNPKLKNSLDADYWALRAAGDLIPQPLHKIFSGHFFPFSQAQDELSRSAWLAMIGFYTHAILGLRWVLELGCMSVYWDRQDNAEEVIKPWLSSQDPTPMKRQVVQGLLEVDLIRTFADRTDFQDEFEEVYGTLNDYAHVRGVRFSAFNLNRGNIPRFNGTGLEQWSSLRARVVAIVVAVHLLKYPVGLQETPLFPKFGLHPPAGGLVEPEDAENMRALFSPFWLEVLQELSDGDEDARSVSAWVNGLPDLTEESLKEQAQAFDRDMVRMQGFRSWLEVQEKFGRFDDPGFTEWVAELRTWAKEKGLSDYGEKGPLPAHNPGQES